MLFSVVLAEALYFEKGEYCTGQAELELMTQIPQLLECWDHKALGAMTFPLRTALLSLQPRYFGLL